MAIFETAGQKWQKKSFKRKLKKENVQVPNSVVNFRIFSCFMNKPFNPVYSFPFLHFGIAYIANCIL